MLNIYCLCNFSLYCYWSLVTMSKEINGGLQTELIAYPAWTHLYSVVKKEMKYSAFSNFIYITFQSIVIICSILGICHTGDV